MTHLRHRVGHADAGGHHDAIRFAYVKHPRGHTHFLLLKGDDADHPERKLFVAVASGQRKVRAKGFVFSTPFLSLRLLWLCVRIFWKSNKNELGPECEIVYLRIVHTYTHVLRVRITPLAGEAR